MLLHFTHANTLTQTYSWNIIYCRFTLSAYTDNYGCSKNPRKQPVAALLGLQVAISQPNHMSKTPSNCFLSLKIEMASRHALYVLPLFTAPVLGPQRLFHTPLHSYTCCTCVCGDSASSCRGQRAKFAYLSMMTGSDGVSFLLPQLFLSQHRLQGMGMRQKKGWGVSHLDANSSESKIRCSIKGRRKQMSI